MRITKMWHKDTKWTNAVIKMMLIDLLNTGHKVASDLQFVENTIKQNTIKRRMPVVVFVDGT